MSRMIYSKAPLLSCKPGFDELIDWGHAPQLATPPFQIALSRFAGTKFSLVHRRLSNRSRYNVEHEANPERNIGSERG